MIVAEINMQEVVTVMEAWREVFLDLSSDVSAKHVWNLDEVC